jgi:predicted dehydrogenase
MTTLNKNNTIRVGVAGLGRSGWNIHAKALQQLPEQYRIVAVMDVSAERRDEAEATLNCRSYDAFDQLVNDDEVELLVVATPNRLHSEHAIEAMQSGRHVVCEKPMALSTRDADRMIAVSKNTGKILAPFQNRRYEAHFQKVRQIVDSGLLGKIIQIRLTWHSFSRRWDWQTLKEFGGGLLNNNGPHLLDHALELLGPFEPEVFVDLHNALSSGDAEDHVKIVLKAEGAPTIDMELTSVCAYPQDRWLVMGTAGGMVGTTSRLQWKWVDWSQMPKRPVQRIPTPDRSYNNETLNWHEDSWEASGDNIPEELSFYHDLYTTLRQNEPLVITPESVRRQIAVIEQCRELCPL